MDKHTRAALVRKWSSELSRLLGRSEEALADRGLEAGDFRSTVSLDFEDGSRVQFRYAFFVRREADPEQVAIFTEHCGYHEFLVGPDDVIAQK